MLNRKKTIIVKPENEFGRDWRKKAVSRLFSTSGSLYRKVVERVDEYGLQSDDVHSACSSIHSATFRYGKLDVENGLQLLQ